jgi:hypothetical protein
MGRPRPYSQILDEAEKACQARHKRSSLFLPGMSVMAKNVS